MEAQDVLAHLQANYPYRFTDAVFVRDGGSRSYRVDGPDGAYFFRDVKPAFSDTARTAADIQLYLHRQGVSVPRILATTDGEPYIALPESDGLHLAVLYEHIAGSEPDMEQDAERVGDLVGRMHRAMRDYDGSLPAREKPFFIDRYLAQQQSMGYPPQKVDAFRRHGERLWARVQQLPRGFCHGDLPVGKLHRAEAGDLFILDFDTACRAFPLFDITLVCNATDYFTYEADGHARTQARLERFLSGYTPHVPVSEPERAAVFDLLAIYHYQLQATILELYGLDCVDMDFLDRQYEWLMRWEDDCSALRG